MKLEVMRFSSQKDDTLGLLFDVTDGRKFMCYTLEDEHRDVKVMHETRVPAGTYSLRLKKWGGFHDRYSNRFSEIHKGMIYYCIAATTVTILAGVFLLVLHKQRM